MLFLGEFSHTIDAKQRLAIPSEIRDAINPEIHGSAFIIAPGANGTLWLWPERTFNEMAAALGSSFIAEDDLMEFERVMFSQAARIALDASGRVRLPERLLQEYDLSGPVMILGVRDHLELCKPDSWAQEQQRLRPGQTEVWRRARQALAERRQEETS